MITDEQFNKLKTEVAILWILIGLEGFTLLCIIFTKK
jgi:hypothetical protein